MAGSTFGELFRITTFGESHGKAVGVVIDGIKPNLNIDVNEIQHELNRRRPGQSSITTPRKEEDKVEILSGIFENKTTGAPICMVIWNKDQNPKVYEQYKDIFRPGHAGFTFLRKYGIYDYYGGGRASGRETIGRVAAGAVAKSMLRSSGIEIIGYTKKVGKIEAKNIDLSIIETNSIRCPDGEAATRMIDLIQDVKSKGDSIGGVVEIIIKNCPTGLGDPVFDKLHADIAKALLSIGAVKGFEIGEGFKVTEAKASKLNDEFIFDKNKNRVRTKTNYQGGILGGMSDGEDIIVRIAVKPPSSILIDKNTIDFNNKPRKIKIEGRHDPCLCPRIVPVAEAMVALVLIDKIMIQETIKRGDSLKELRGDIDAIDHKIMLLLSERQEISKLIGKEKEKISKPVFDKSREAQVLKERISFAKKLRLDPAFIEKLYKSIFETSKKVQKGREF
jgi:chorismate synthase